MGSNRVEHFLAPVMGMGEGKLLHSIGGEAPLAHEISEGAIHHSFSTEYALMSLTVLIVFCGILLAYLMYMRKRALPEAIAAKSPFSYRLLLNKWYIDELYEKMVIRPLHGFGMFLWKGVDVVVIDGLVNGTARFFMKCGNIAKASQTGYVQRYAVSFLVGAVVLAAYYMYMN